MRDVHRASFFAGAHHATVLVADPPWEFSDALGARGAAANYDVQHEDWLANIVLPAMDPTGSLLLMWRVGAMVEEAYRAVRAWGYTPKSEIVWRKLTTKGNRSFGMGRYVRWEHESCIIAVKGKNPVANHSIRSTFDADEILEGGGFDATMGMHSQKPEEFFDIIEQLVPTGPYVELFARRRRPGWNCYGNALGHNIL